MLTGAPPEEGIDGGGHDHIGVFGGTIGGIDVPVGDPHMYDLVADAELVGTRQIARGTWDVVPRPDGGSTIRIRFDGDVRGGRAGAAPVKRMAARATRDLEATLDSYERTARDRGSHGNPAAR